MEYATLLDDAELRAMATSDLFWDRVVSVEPAGDEEVFVGVRHRMRDAGVPGGAINSVAEAFDGAEIAQRGLVTTIPHPTAGTVPNVALSIRLHGTPLADPVAAPRLGQHTTQVLRDLLGYDAERIRGLVDGGVVRQAAGM